VVRCSVARRSDHGVPHPSRDRDVRSVIIDHLEHLAVGDLAGDVLRNYSADVLVLCPSGASRGVEGLLAHVRQLAQALGEQACLDYERLWLRGPLAYLEWTAATATVVCNGAESFVVADGRIIAQTVHYRVADADNRYAVAPPS
jgi:hypothetical protein